MQKTVEFPQVPFFVMPVVMQDRCLVQTVQKTVVFVVFLQAVLEEVVDMPVVCATGVVFWGPDVQKSAEAPQVPFLDVVVPIVLQRQASCPSVQLDSWRCLRFVHRQGARGLRERRRGGCAGELRPPGR